MYCTMEDIKKELQELCTEYVNILDMLKDNNLISEYTYNRCTEQKISFLDD